jgi:hypothetical protein
MMNSTFNPYDPPKGQGRALGWFPFLTFPAAVANGLVAIVLNNVTVATNDYTNIVLGALICASIALVFSALSWRRSSLTRRIVLLLLVVGDVQTLVDAGGRRLPAVLHW